MPIVSIHSISPEDQSAIPRMMEHIQNEGSLALKTPRDNVWVVFHPLSYYLNGLSTPYVTIKAQAGRGLAEKTAFAEVIAGVVSQSISVPAQNVWIQYEEISPDNIWYASNWANREPPK